MHTDITNPQPQPQMQNISDSYPIHMQRIEGMSNRNTNHPHGLNLPYAPMNPGVQHSHAKIMQDYSYRVNNNPFFLINSQMSNLPMFHSPMQAFPYSQNSNQVINQSQTQPQMRNMSDPPHMQKTEGMSNYNTNHSYPPHGLNLPYAPMNSGVQHSHPTMMQDYSYRVNNNPFFPINSLNSYMPNSFIPNFRPMMPAFPYSQNSNQVINQSQQSQPQPQPQCGDPKLVKKKGCDFCGLCNRYYSHLWRHFENKHRSEPAISNLLNLTVVNKREFDVQWNKVKSEMLHRNGLIPKSVSICTVLRTLISQT